MHCKQIVCNNEKSMGVLGGCGVCVGGWKRRQSGAKKLV